MSKQFLKKGELQILGKNYLASNNNTPVGNAEFVQAQKAAEYVVKFAEMAKGKDFKGKVAEDLGTFRLKVMEVINSSSTVEFITKPKEVSRPTSEKLQKEALDFIGYQEKLTNVNKINDFLQSFKVIKDFEDFGLFFEEEIVNLNRIYTMDEIIKAVEEVITLL